MTEDVIGKSCVGMWREGIARIRGESGIAPYAQYADDPVGFCETIFGEHYTDDVKAMMNSVAANKLTVAKSCTGVGKTHGLARVAVSWILTRNGAEVYTYAAPPQDNLMLLWREINGLVRKHPKVFEHYQCTTMKIEWGENLLKGMIIAMSGSPDDRVAKASGKHAPHLLFIMDEADAIPPEVFKGVDGCMSSAGSRMVCCYNPKHPAGAVYNMMTSKRANVLTLSAFEHPNVITGKNIIPGAVSRNETVNRIFRWTHELPLGEEPGRDCFEIPECLYGVVEEDEKGGSLPPIQPGFRRIVDPEFSYKVLGEYPAQSDNALISRDWYETCRKRWNDYVKINGMNPSVKGYHATMGLDVGGRGSDPSVACFRYGGWVEPFVRWNGGGDPDITVERATDEYKKRLVRVCGVDADGIGFGIASKMCRLGCNAFDVINGAKPTERSEDGRFANIRAQLHWKLRVWMRDDPTAMLPPSEYLGDELMVLTWHVDELGRILIVKKDIIRDTLRRSPDESDSLVYTFAPGAVAGSRFGDDDWG